MTRTLRPARLTAALLFAVLVALPGAAGASTVLEYQLQYEPAVDRSLLIVTAVADPQLPLPVTITLPVPAGATVLWAGEVLGGPTTSDPARETSVETIGDMDVYTMTLEQARTAQLELQLPPASASGSRTSGTFTWTNPGEEIQVNASVILPAGATQVELSPAVGGDTRTNDSGETLYPLTGARLAQGAPMVLEASWSTGSAAADDEAGTQTLPVLLGLLVAAIVALVIAVVRERTRARRAGATVGL